jgi:hypothetical protein
MAMGISYDGPYKYGMDLPTKLQPRLKQLCTQFFPQPYAHTAKKGARYDYTQTDNPNNHFSAKSIKKGGGKVAPQVIGQATPEKFCEVLGIPFTTNEDLKKYLQEHPHQILPSLVEYTFDCPNVYYNEEKNTIQYIEMVSAVDWSQYEYEWTCPHDTWNNSSTLKLKTPTGSVALVEFQFHSKSRKNLVIRWCYETFLHQFKDHLLIVDF